MFFYKYLTNIACDIPNVSWDDRPIGYHSHSGIQPRRIMLHPRDYPYLPKAPHMATPGGWPAAWLPSAIVEQYCESSRSTSIVIIFRKAASKRERCKLACSAEHESARPAVKSSCPWPSPQKYRQQSAVIAVIIRRAISSA